jgi:DNA-binding protein HU-beta
MNKQELIVALAEEHELPKAQASRIVDSLFSSTGILAKELKKGNKIALAGFGVFQVRARAARKARNPQTGEVVKVKASKVPAFKAGAGLKNLVNGKKK